MLLAIAGAPPPEVSVVQAPRTSTLFVAIHLPAKELGGTSVSQVVDRVFKEIERSTYLKGSLVPDTVMQACSDEASGQQGMTCLVNAVRQDYVDWAAAAGAGAPVPSEMLEGVRSGRFLLLLSAVGPERIVGLLLDTKEALPIIHRGKEVAPKELEDALSERAVVGATLPTEVASPEQLEVFISGLFERKFADVLERAGLRGASGEIQLRVAPGGAVLLDGEEIGRAQGPLRVREVPAGRHVVAVIQEGFERFEQTVQVEPRGLVTVEAILLEEPDPHAEVGRDAVLWTGAVSGVVGAALSVAGAVAPGSDQAACAGDACDDRTFRRFGGVPLLPLGYSLAGAGLAWSLGSLLGSERDFPWIEIVSGLAVFGVAFGVSVALEPGCSAPGCVDGR